MRIGSDSPRSAAEIAVIASSGFVFFADARSVASFTSPVEKSTRSFPASPAALPNVAKSVAPPMACRRDWPSFSAAPSPNLEIASNADPNTCSPYATVSFRSDAASAAGFSAPRSFEPAAMPPAPIAISDPDDSFAFDSIRPSSRSPVSPNDCRARFERPVCDSTSRPKSGTSTRRPSGRRFFANESSRDPRRGRFGSISTPTTPARFAPIRSARPSCP